jgi:8-oxo-dGTP diphosphatase
MKKTKKVIWVVAVVLVDSDGRILLTQRPEGKAMAGLWEFAGGKMEADETPEQTLVRELKEELGIDVLESALTPLTFASHAYETFHLVMPVYLCRAWGGEISPQEKQSFQWVSPADLNQYAMPPADIPLIPLIQKLV